MNNPLHPSHSKQNIFAHALVVISPVIFGQLVVLLAIWIRPTLFEDIGVDSFPLPPWALIVVWIVIYAGMGQAAWRIYHLNIREFKVPLLALLMAGFIQSHMFWATNSTHATAVIDASGLLFAITICISLAFIDRRAIMWLLPWFIWMPTTLMIKLNMLGVF